MTSGVWMKRKDSSVEIPTLRIVGKQQSILLGNIVLLQEITNVWSGKDLIQAEFVPELILMAERDLARLCEITIPHPLLDDKKTL